ncbi:MAG: hypothetical protein JO328_14510 [Hyphomicrobiales bacterium]|nr:hypothetical protein [Hyphomicrobiales bacterium]MBV9428099.1 hypothetical protein [Bradyrhizobiaceae bacterium]
MRFQPGRSGNPAGRPPGSLNKQTLAAQEAMIERGQEVINSIVDRAKNGESAAMRAVVERLLPTGRNRRVAIDLPVIKTPEDAELALSVVTDELSAGNLTISEASALVNLIDRMLRVAERMWNFARAKRYAAQRDAIMLDDEGPSQAAATADPAAPEAAGKPAAPLYSPVNSEIAAGGEPAGIPARQEGGSAGPGSRHDKAPPLPRAA